MKTQTINEMYAAQLSGAVPLDSENDVPVKTKEPNQEPQAFSAGYQGSVYSNTGMVAITTGVFNGEKNAGELGNPMNLIPDSRALRFRAYELALTSDIVKTVFGKFAKFVIGNGLKMQAEPYEKILKLEKVTFNNKDFTENVEQYFDLWANTIGRSSYNGKGNLHDLANLHESNKYLGGDSLVVVRLDEKLNVKVQVVDGQHVVNPVIGPFHDEAKSRGNSIKDGIELGKYGNHVAFFVKKERKPDSVLYMDEIERIEAYNKETGLTMAWLGYGSKHRGDHHRGISSLAPVMEKVQKLDRYVEATISTLEERAKIVNVLQHGKTSTGESHLMQEIKKNVGNQGSPGSYEMGEGVAKKISITEGKTVYNLPVDSELKAVSSQTEINFDPFYKAIFNQICASQDIPPEVAMQMYNSNYSASRAAINAWGFVLDVYRENSSKDFYHPIYQIWLYVHALKGKVEATGLLKAMDQDNREVVDAYSAAKFTGRNMPHIDPLKEIKAIGEALDRKLISNEYATELAGYGDWETNAQKLSDENKEKDRLGLSPVVEEPADKKPVVEKKKAVE